jgi:polysaccharide export outer membrane protein
MATVALLTCISLASAGEEAMSAPRPSTAQAPEQAAESRPSPLSYRFGIGDVVEFRFPYTPELDFTAPVRPDGAIFFPYLGDLALLDLTVQDLSVRLRSRYAGILKAPEVTIVIRSFQPPRVFVTGEIRTPGRLDYQGGMTVTQALAAAGGFLDSANTKQVIVLRPASTVALQVTIVDISRGEGRAGDAPLAPNDIVVVAKSRVARLGQIVRQYSRDLLPVSSLGLFFDLVGSAGGSVVIGGGGQ